MAPDRPAAVASRRKRVRSGAKPRCYGHYRQAEKCRACRWLVRCCDLQLLSE